MIILPDTDPILRSVAEPITEFGPVLVSLCEEMYETMVRNNGIGLAAPQVGISKRIIIVQLQTQFARDKVLINPEITTMNGTQCRKEGCLSFPGLFLDVNRAKSVIVKYQDMQGKENIVVAEGLDATILQHEIDHLNGKLFVDHVKQMTLLLAKKKLALRG